MQQLDAQVPGQLKIERLADADGAVLVLNGELDLASAPELERHLQEIAETDFGRLLVDLSGLGFMDSTGLGVIVAAQQSAEVNGHKLVLRRGTKQVQRLFELTGIADRFTFED